MKRRVVLISCLVAVIGGGAGAALASSGPSVNSNSHEICVGLASSDNYKHAQYYCVTTP